MILGKVGSVSSSNNNNTNVSGPRNNNSNHGSNSDLSRNGLGGLFSGGMPKLKPTGRGYCKYLNMCRMCDCKKIFPFMEWLYNMKFSLTKLSFI
jgi:hypothetical protein